jgi:hypothetical protein
MSWTMMETSTHQDHVIAHVIGATPLRPLTLLRCLNRERRGDWCWFVREET